MDRETRETSALLTQATPDAKREDNASLQLRS